MKAIFTKYHGPGNVKGSRISASDGENRVVISRDCALRIEDSHNAAAVALCQKMGWTGKLARGEYSRGYIYVWTDGDHWRGDLLRVYRWLFTRQGTPCRIVLRDARYRHPKDVDLDRLVMVEYQSGGRKLLRPGQDLKAHGGALELVTAVLEAEYSELLDQGEPC